MIDISSEKTSGPTTRPMTSNACTTRSRTHRGSRCAARAASCVIRRGGGDQILALSGKLIGLAVAFYEGLLKECRRAGGCTFGASFRIKSPTSAANDHITKR